jgi:hypothetical protein|tara:strand:+ start:311 stop:496 length:186 start_codon:yes stop_codon:yes gene_type:complete
MQVGDLVINTHPSSGCAGMLGIITEKSKVLKGSFISLIKVVCEGKEILWLTTDCEVIGENR